MKSIICYYSYHHNNTEKIAITISEVIGAKTGTPQTLTPKEVIDYDLIGLGAGIDSGKHYGPLLEFANSMPATAEKKKVFLFSTAGISSEKKLIKDHKALREILIAKGYNIIGEFACKGFNTNSFLKFIGGMNKEHPNADDIISAQDFAQGLLKKC